MMPPTPTPCHIVTGPLGVGKTSSILHYLRNHTDPHGVGVLVNDFGPVGLDSTMVEAESPSTTVMNVPGGCLCCTMLAELATSVHRLKTEHDVHRIIIEPSGMASPAHIIDVLRAQAQSLDITVHPTIAILSATDFDPATLERGTYYRGFYEPADILVWNRCDLATELKVQEAIAWTHTLTPPKLQVFSTSYGQLPEKVFAMPQPRTSTSMSADEAHVHDQSIYAGGLVCHRSQVFESQELLTNLLRLCQDGISGTQVLRLKGVFHTDAGWRSLEIANQEVISHPSSHRTDSRVEWVTQPTSIDEAVMLQELTRPLMPSGD